MLLFPRDKIYPPSHMLLTLVTHLSKLIRERTTSLGAGPLQCRV